MLGARDSTLNFTYIANHSVGPIADKTARPAQNIWRSSRNPSSEPELRGSDRISVGTPTSIRPLQSRKKGADPFAFANQRAIVQMNYFPTVHSLRCWSNFRHGEETDMPFTKCPKCRKVQQVSPTLAEKSIGCMNTRCAKCFRAFEYRLHSGVFSRAVFWFVIAFAVFLTARWIWLNAVRIVYWMG